MSVRRTTQESVSCQKTHRPTVAGSTKGPVERGMGPLSRAGATKTEPYSRSTDKRGLRWLMAVIQARPGQGGALPCRSSPHARSDGSHDQRKEGKVNGG
jgi:hypothetical protein